MKANIQGIAHVQEVGGGGEEKSERRETHRALSGSQACGSPLMGVERALRGMVRAWGRQIRSGAVVRS